MAGMERAQAYLDAAALLVSAKLAALRKRVTAANAAAAATRDCIDAEARAKWRRARSGQAGEEEAAGVSQNPDEQAESAFGGQAVVAEERLQSAGRGLAQLADQVQQARAGVDAAKASAAPLLAVGRPAAEAKQLAALLEERNEACSTLLRLPMPVQLVVVSTMSVVQLWRARGVSRHVSRLATEVLEGLPRLVSVGGVRVTEGEDDIEIRESGPEVEVLNLSTMRWSAAGPGVPPPLPWPLCRHALSAFEDGRIVVTGGVNDSLYENGDGEELEEELDEFAKQALQWSPGSAAWSVLSTMGAPRKNASSVALPDGRLLVAGGTGDDGDVMRNSLASAEVLEADGSSWVAAASMSGPRTAPVAGLLPSGRLIVAGGCSGFVVDDYANNGELRTAEQYDPVTGTWSGLPQMAVLRNLAAGCTLEDGRFAVVGGLPSRTYVSAEKETNRSGEVFDPEVSTWEPLRGGDHSPAMMETGRSGHALTAVAGGMIAIGGHFEEYDGQYDGADAEYDGADAELYDLESGRWIELPHAMGVSRSGSICGSVMCAHVVSVPVSALNIHGQPAARNSPTPRAATAP